MNAAWRYALDHWNDIASAIAGLGGVAAAVAAWRAAVRSNQTADAVAAIERDRWHAELTPQFEVTATRLGPGVDLASLRIALIGPTGLLGLERVVLRVRDDGYTHQPLGEVTQEMIDETIFGPYRFEPGIDGASQDGRTVTSRPLRLGDWGKFSIATTPVPDWSNADLWSSRHEGNPIRLSLECHADGHKPWYVTYEVPVVDPRDAQI
jgi:hypothetical protein